MKKALIPGYGKKEMGILHPKKAIYNKVYRKTTFGSGDLFKLFKKPGENMKTSISEIKEESG